jgi:DeoR/GlpR family transcriptional regulator of sugar metabolism
MTNDVGIAGCLKNSSLAVVDTGGMMQNSTGCLLGNFAEDVIDRVRPNIAFMGATAIDEDSCVSTPTLEKTSMKKKVIANSQKSYLLADGAKFYIHSSYIIYTLSDFNGVISDMEFPESGAEKPGPPRNQYYSRATINYFI